MQLEIGSPKSLLTFDVSEGKLSQIFPGAALVTRIYALGATPEFQLKDLHLISREVQPSCSEMSDRSRNVAHASVLFRTLCWAPYGATRIR